MFFQSETILSRKNEQEIFLFGQDISAVSLEFAKEELDKRGLTADIRLSQKGSLIDDKFSCMKFDYIICNPPFNLKKWIEKDVELPGDLTLFGEDVRKDGNFAWISHVVSKLENTCNTGKAAFVVCNISGSKLYKKLIESGHVYCFLKLPVKMFFNTTIQCWIYFFSKELNQEIFYQDLSDKFKPVERSQNEITKEVIEQCYEDFLKLHRYSKEDIVSLKHLETKKPEREHRPIKEILDEYKKLSEEARAIEEKIFENFKKYGLD
jgi:type I restriction-modification system DNA methylase subunit